MTMRRCLGIRRQFCFVLFHVTVEYRWNDIYLLLKWEFAEIDVIFGGGDQVNQLTHFCLIRRLCKPYRDPISFYNKEKRGQAAKLDANIPHGKARWYRCSMIQIGNVSWATSKWQPRAWKHHWSRSIRLFRCGTNKVDHDELRSHPWYRPKRGRRLGAVIGHWCTTNHVQSIWSVMWGKRGKTDEFDTPSEDGSFQVLVVRQSSSFQDLNRIDNRDPAIQFSTRDIVIQVLHATDKSQKKKKKRWQEWDGTNLPIPLRSLLWHSLAIEMRQEFVPNHLEHLFEFLALLSFQISSRRHYQKVFSGG